ncbi:MAG: response regulator [Elusimicrobiales bacterium]|nr:response regulator [Elusimicrobiales bacterium]
MKRLLIIDDNIAYLNSLKNALKSEFEIITASTLQEAKEKAKSVDICLVDMRLNDDDIYNEDGLEFYKWMNKYYPKTPIILVTAWLNNEETKAMNEKGIITIKKPIDIKELKNKLNNLSKEAKQ